MHIVEINHIKKSFDDTEVLKDISLFVDKARLALNDGEIFFGGEAFDRVATGSLGHGFMRMNVGTQRSVLEQALRQLRDAVSQL